MALNHCAVVIMFLALCCCVWSQIDSSEDFQDEESGGDTPDGKLVQVSVVARHGQRTPKEPYPADPYRDPSYWPEGWLQLTARGADQHRALGRSLRGLYNQTIPLIYTSDTVRIRSTGISRTLASAYALVSTLFPGQAIPIHSAPSRFDRLFSPHKSCPAFKRAMEEYLDSPEVREEERRRQPFYEWTAKQTGKRFSGVDAAEGLYSLLTIEKQRGHTLPRWTERAYPQPLKNLTAVYLARSSATPLIARLRYGALLKDILQNAQHAAKRTNKKFLLYSAHDFTVVGLLNCMGVFDGQPSGFASTITFEVRYSKSQRGNTVDMYYRNETEASPVKLQVKGCGSPCHVLDLMDVLSPMLPEDIDRECQEEISMDSGSCAVVGSHVGVITVLATVVLCLSVVALVLLCCPCARETKILGFNRKHQYMEIL